MCWVDAGPSSQVSHPDLKPCKRIGDLHDRQVGSYHPPGGGAVRKSIAHGHESEQAFRVGVFSGDSWQFGRLFFFFDYGGGTGINCSETSVFFFFFFFFPASLYNTYIHQWGLKNSLLLLRIPSLANKPVSFVCSLYPALLAPFALWRGLARMPHWFSSIRLASMK